MTFCRARSCCRSQGNVVDLDQTAFGTDCFRLIETLQTRDPCEGTFEMMKTAKFALTLLALAAAPTLAQAAAGHAEPWQIGFQDAVTLPRKA